MQCNSQAIKDDLLIAKKEGLICYSRKQCEISTHEVVNCMIPKGGHHWPGQLQMLAIAGMIYRQTRSLTITIVKKTTLLK